MKKKKIEKIKIDKNKREFFMLHNPDKLLFTDKINEIIEVLNAKEKTKK